jgi:hypothetical protein
LPTLNFCPAVSKGCIFLQMNRRSWWWYCVVVVVAAVALVLVLVLGIN